MPVTERPSQTRFTPASSGASDQSVRLCARRNPEAPREAFVHFRIQARTLERPRASHGAERLVGGAQWLVGGAELLKHVAAHIPELRSPYGDMSDVLTICATLSDFLPPMKT